MIDGVVTDLLGEVVEVYEYGDGHDSFRLRGRGYVRAVYVADKALMVLVEHSLGHASATYGDRTRDGGFGAYSFHEGRVRVVQHCQRCSTWDQKALLSHIQTDNRSTWIWRHKDGEGCKKVGHGG